MLKVLTSRQARQVDELTCREIGIPNLLLMENAATRLVEYVETYLDDLRGRRILILAGKGNNGGDGLAAARQLLMRGAMPQVCLLSDPHALKGDARTNYEMAVAFGNSIFEAYPAKAPKGWPPEWKNYDVLVDAILGTGMRGRAEGLPAEAIEWINNEFSGHIVAVDLPSGLVADTGQVSGPAVCADATVAFTVPKLCHLLHPAAHCTGELLVAPIGTPNFQLAREEFTIELFDRGQPNPILQSRPSSSHKGQFGRILVLAGGRGKAGAAAMAAMGALKSGAGLVTVAVPRSSQELVASYAPELMSAGLAENSRGVFSSEAAEMALTLAQDADIVALGPGIGQDSETSEFIQLLLEQLQLPVILDADAINLLAALGGHPLSERRFPTVLTPHPGEMSRLASKSTQEIQANRLECARDYALRQGVFVVLKGARSLIASPEGKIMINTTGNPGMATAGSGDVLTGMAASILAQYGNSVGGALSDRQTIHALATAVCWHGLAGDCAAATGGQLPLSATDLLDYLPEALKVLGEAEGYHPGGIRRPFFKI